MGRFISADSVVPGAADGSLEGVALKPLTVDFHEPGFVSRLAQEDQFGPWFQLSDDEKQQLGSPWGPANPQALNRSSYGLNNPVKYQDPTGHETRCTSNYSACSGARVTNNSTSHSVLIRGDIVLPDGTVLEHQVIRLGPGESSHQLGMIDVDEVYVDGVPIDGNGARNKAKLSDAESVVINDDGSGGLSATLGGGWFGIGNHWSQITAEEDAAVRAAVTSRRGADMSNTRQMSLAEAVLAREFINRGWALGGYRDCAQGGCHFP